MYLDAAEYDDEKAEVDAANQAAESIPPERLDIPWVLVYLLFGLFRLCLHCTRRLA
jgi:hypothetical protein